MPPQNRALPMPRRHLLITTAALATTVGGLATPAVSRASTVTPGALPPMRQWQMEAGGNSGRSYRILAGWPEGAAPPGGFPVLYVLDGDALFAPALQRLREQAALPGATPAVAQAVVIGIGYPGETNRRDLDYTLPYPAAPAHTGAAEHFLDFIQHELMPEIARHFPVDTSRQAIFGHSYGGLLVLHSLFTRPSLFHRHVAASPSIWWGGGVVLQEEKAFRDNPPENARDLGLMITVGGLEGAGRPGMTPAEREAWNQARPAGNGQEMIDRLAALGDRAPAALEFLQFEGETHSSVVNPAIARSLRFALPMA